MKCLAKQEFQLLRDISEATRSQLIAKGTRNSAFRKQGRQNCIFWLAKFCWHFSCGQTPSAALWHRKTSELPKTGSIHLELFRYFGGALCTIESGYLQNGIHPSPFFSRSFSPIHVVAVSFSVSIFIFIHVLSELAASMVIRKELINILSL